MKLHLIVEGEEGAGKTSLLKLVAALLYHNVTIGEGGIDFTFEPDEDGFESMTIDVAALPEKFLGKSAAELGTLVGPQTGPREVRAPRKPIVSTEGWRRVGQVIAWVLFLTAGALGGAIYNAIVGLAP